MRFIRLLAVLMTLASCGPAVPVIDTSAIDNAQRSDLAAIKVFTLGSNVDRPFKVVGVIESYSCKRLTTDPPASKSDALLQLRINAKALAADAISDVTFDERGTDTWGTRCWETVQASGTAIQWDNSE